MNQAALLGKGMQPLPRLPRGWQWRRIGDLLTFRNEIVHPRDRPTGEAVFVGLEHIEKNTGRRLGQVPIRLEAMTGRRARFYKGDIVYGYLRPYLNKVWIAEFDGLCSVDQYVFIPDRDVDREFVAHYMRSDLFLLRAPIDESPGQLPRIRSQEVAKVPIPLPSRPEQRRIAAKLQSQRTSIDAVHQLDSERTIATQTAAREFARLLWTDLVMDAHRKPLADLCQIAGSLVDPKSPAVCDLPCISSEHICSNSGRFLGAPSAAEQRMISGKFHFRGNTILYSKIRPYLRKATYIQAEALCSADIYPLAVKGPVSPKFLLAILLSDEFSRYAVEASARARMPKLNREQLFSWRAPVPPVDAQERYLLRAAAVGQHAESAASLIGQRLMALPALRNSLLRTAFSGGF